MKGVKIFTYVLTIVAVLIIGAAVYVKITERKGTIPNREFMRYEANAVSDEKKSDAVIDVPTPSPMQTAKSTPEPTEVSTQKPESTPAPKPQSTPTFTSTPKTTPVPTPVPTRSFDHEGQNTSKHYFVADAPYNDVTEVKFSTIVNVNNRLSRDFVPKNLVRIRDYVNTDIVTFNFSESHGNKTAVLAFAEMMEAAYADGVTGFYLRDVYRSYDTQTRLWNKRLAADSNYGRHRNTPLGSAYPGTSEHQTGLAFDITCLSSKEATSSFRHTANYRWLKANSYKFGFILRYDSTKTSVTGIKYEPYHYRYVGKKLAKTLLESGQTLEEYFNCPVEYYG